MDQNAPTLTRRPVAREIGTAGMMMNYTEPRIIAEQIAALKNLGLLDAAMPSIEEHNPVLAAAISTGREHFIDYDAMEEKPQEYYYDGSNGEGFIGQTYTWVAYLHYELQTVALFSLLDLLETGELQQDQIADYSVALGDTSLKQNAFLAFNFNPDRQPYELFDGIKDRFRAEDFGLQTRGYDLFYSVPSFLWAGLNSEQRGRVAAELIVRKNGQNWGSFEDRILGREFGKLLSSIFAWHKGLNHRGISEGSSQTFSLEWGERFIQGRVEFTDEGFLWIEELRGLTSAR